jgi:hypothetical protein
MPGKSAVEVSSREMPTPLGRVTRSEPSNDAWLQGFPSKGELLVADARAWVTITGISVGVERSALRRLFRSDFAGADAGGAGAGGAGAAAGAEPAASTASLRFHRVMYFGGSPCWRQYSACRSPEALQASRCCCQKRRAVDERIRFRLTNDVMPPPEVWAGAHSIKIAGIYQGADFRTDTMNYL